MADLYKNKNFRNTFFLIFLAELLSFLGYYNSGVNSLGFFILALATMFVAFFEIEYGLYILLTELFIGSFGYLFYFETEGLNISIRIAFWLIIMSVWLAKVIIGAIKTKKLTADFFRLNGLAPFVALIIFIAWGLVNGLINGNSLSNIFFDFNNWLYFLLIFPIFSIFKNDDQLKTIKSIFLASTTWLSAKTIFLAYVFTHNLGGLDLEIYRWMRVDRLGEITTTSAGFSRIFMQSQIFVLIGFFIILFYLLKTIAEKNTSQKKFLLNIPGNLLKQLGLLTLFLSTIIISFSRSYWLGLLAGGVFVWLVILFKLKIKFKQFIFYNSIILFIVILSLILTTVAVKFPYPYVFGGFNPADILSQRLTQVTGEAGASSRWQLLPPLWQKINTSPILGRGFGATVTYKTSDPRVLENRPDGLYTTYSFEWGWLDVWLKLGLFGLLAYLFLFIKIIRDSLKINSYLALSLSAGLVVLAIVNIFSPYINHPLGIGYIILTMAIMENLKIKTMN